MKKREGFLFVLFILFILLILFWFNQLDKILHSPTITPEEWCINQPCLELELFSRIIILVQPSSTFFVYLLGILAIIISGYIIKIGKNQKFLYWWGIALLLWGIGALFAGTSYQAFSYEIKCADRGSCVWTSLWEIFYLILSVGSVNAMLIAQGNLEKKEKWKRFMLGYADANFIVYVIIVVNGAIIPNQFLISFELMILFLAPTIFYLLIFNIRKYLHLRKPIYRSLVIIWISLIIIIALYFLYFLSDLTNILWKQGIWFSENDVLHISLILWVIYISLSTRKIFFFI